MASKGNKELGKKTKKSALNGASVLIVKTDWNSEITNALSDGCKKQLKSLGIGWKEITVPGAVEIPFAIRHSWEHMAPRPDAFIALGCVIKGDTPHFDYVCQSVTQGLSLLNTQLNRPVIFGVLTVNTEEQAHERIGGKHGHKGVEAADTAAAMIALVKTGKQ